MEPRKLTYIANWKTYLSHAQMVQWSEKHTIELGQLANKAKIIICPGFTALQSTRSNLDPNVLVGAQNCSAYSTDAHTGQVTALSLKEIGATHCIVGHSEARTQLHETPNEVAEKVTQLFKHNVKPIICVSDNIEIELPPIIGKIKSAEQIIIAYEPISAIGTGQVPSNEQIKNMFKKIINLVAQQKPNTKLMLLYGGSVNPETVSALKLIDLLNGFLIGKASTDFQLLKKIVEL